MWAIIRSAKQRALEITLREDRETVANNFYHYILEPISTLNVVGARKAFDYFNLQCDQFQQANCVLTAGAIELLVKAAVQQGDAKFRIEQLNKKIAEIDREIERLKLEQQKSSGRNKFKL